MKILHLTLYFFPILAACGGGSDSSDAGRSGVAGTKSVTELTASEASQYCDWSLRVTGGAGSITKCADGSERQTHTQEQCLKGLRKLQTVPLPCSITVTDAETCALETQNDACGKQPACDRINECVDKGTKK